MIRMFGSSTRRGARRGRHLMTAAAAVLAATALVLAVLGWRAQRHTSGPPASAAHPAAERSAPVPSDSASPRGTSHRTRSARPPSPTPSVSGPSLDRAEPISLSIPTIGIHHAQLAAYGTTRDGAIDIPPATGGVPAGWYTGSPTPGQLGPSVIVGHIDSDAEGPSIFYHLSELRPGDRVSVVRDDGTVAVFTVDSLESYPKDAFPTQMVYGNINRAGLRLISCTGQFDSDWGHYEDNLVVYAHLTSTHPA